MADEQRWDNGPIRYAHVGFRAESQAGEWVVLPTELAKRYRDEPGRTRVFAQTAQGVAFSADEMLVWYLRRTMTTASDHCPSTIATDGRAVVDFPIGFPPGAFHIVTDQGDIDLKRLVLVVEFSQLMH